MLREINELSYREIADVVGVPVGTVRGQVQQAGHLGGGTGGVGLLGAVSGTGHRVQVGGQRPATTGKVHHRTGESGQPLFLVAVDPGVRRLQFRSGPPLRRVGLGCDRPVDRFRGGVPVPNRVGVHGVDTGPVVGSLGPRTVLGDRAHGRRDRAAG